MTPNDLDTYTRLLRLEHDAGQAVPLTQASLWDFMSVVDDVVRGPYAAVTDGQMRGWFDTLLKGMIDTQTSYGQAILGNYLAVQYGRWLQANGDWYPPYWAYESDGWHWPDTPGYFHDAIQNTFWNTWQSTKFPASLFGDYEHADTGQRIAFEQGVVDPAKWSDARKLSVLVDGIVAQQAASVRGLVTAKAMTADAALPLLLQLLGMVTSSQPADVHLAGQLASRSASSPEYPNDTFINQLVYFVLMSIADPLGDFGWSNAQLQTLTKTLVSLIRSTDPGSTAIRTSLDRHYKILFSATGYPMTDPYAPSTAFPVRQTDTLAALNAALKSAALPEEDKETAAPDLTPKDLTALSNTARMQGGIGAAQLTNTGILDFMYRLENFARDVAPDIIAPVDAMLGQLAALPTSYNKPFPALWAAWNWGYYFQIGYQDWYYQSVTYDQYAWRCARQPPSGPKIFADAVTDQWNTLKTGPLILDIDIGERQNDPRAAQNKIVSYQYGLFDPAKWTDAKQAAVSAPAIWTQQAADIATWKGTPLDEARCTRLLYRLVGLTTSPKPADQRLAQQIAALPTDSQELPNDTFADQLLYYALMSWVDPRGMFLWVPGQIATEVDSLLTSVPNTDPGSVLLQNALKQQAAVLRASASYPMVDPDNPGIGFRQRKADTLAALNAAWSKA